MKYPAYSLDTIIPSSSTLQALGIDGFETAGFCSELDTLFIELKNPALLRQLQPDYKKLVASAPQIDEVVLMAASDDEAFDFILRSFCPWIGIDEDPATGSVHSVLGPYWKNKLGKEKLKAYQASARGGHAFLDVADAHVQIGGNAVLIAGGTISV